MARYTVFYGTQVYDSIDSLKFNVLRNVPDEIYNGAYLYDATEREWFRMDRCPVLLEDVPKILRMLVLVLNL